MNTSVECLAQRRIEFSIEMLRAAGQRDAAIRILRDCLEELLLETYPADRLAEIARMRAAEIGAPILEVS